MLQRATPLQETAAPKLLIDLRHLQIVLVRKSPVQAGAVGSASEDTAGDARE